MVITARHTANVSAPGPWGAMLQALWMLLVVAFLVCAVHSPARAQSNQTVHVVKSGETLSRIAAHYRVSYLILARYNGIVNPSQIFPGQRLRIPPAATPAPHRPTPTLPGTADGPITVSVQPTSTSAVHHQPQATTAPAARPTATRSACLMRVYTVRRGDSISVIAAIFGTSHAAILQRNGLSGSIIYVGQRLFIPMPGCPS